MRRIWVALVTTRCSLVVVAAAGAVATMPASGNFAFTADGTLYVLEWESGNLWRGPPAGPRSLIASGLILPGSLAIGPDGAFFVLRLELQHLPARDRSRATDTSSAFRADEG